MAEDHPHQPDPATRPASPGGPKPSEHLRHQVEELRQQTHQLQRQNEALEFQNHQLEKQNNSLEAQTEQLRRQSEFLHAIKGHFIPEAEAARERRWRRALTMLAIKIVAALTSFVAIAQFGAWLLDQWAIDRMAQRYADVARAIYYDENNPDVALTFLNHAIELRDGNSEFRFMRAYIDGMAVARKLLNLDRPLTRAELDQAHQALAQALFLKGLSPRRPEPYILEGQVHVALKLYADAQADLNQAIALDPRSDYAHLRLGMLLAEQNKLDPALSEITRALEINPRSKWAWLWQGIITADKKQDPVAARKSYDKALELDPRFDMAWYNAAWTWLAAEPKDYAKAREMMEKALAINPDYKEACYGLGMVYGYQDRYEQADVYMSKAIALDDKFTTAWKWRGIIRGEMDRHADALQDFGKAIELDPKNAELYVRRAKSYEKLNRLNESIGDLRYALELDAKNEKTWLYLGNVMIKAGEKAKALEYYDKALALQPAYDEAWAQKAAVYVEQNQPRQAIEALNRALQAARYRPERYYYQRGRLLENTKDSAGALADYRKARQGDPAFAEAWLAEGKLLKETGKTSESLSAIGRYIELRPEDKTARELRDALQKK